MNTIMSIVDFFVWSKKTHPQVIANLMSGYKKFREQLKEEEE
tara:strand:- start:9802 stop:9927 length:126 start_codon:yes stop_codon:yes gene_type:complete